METLLRVLSEDEKTEVHERSLKILAETGSIFSAIFPNMCKIPLQMLNSARGRSLSDE